ncbi:hypothetical protein C8Q75DRAFT_746895 [Abortiporus biennis]|nr:hypothetical protein C8Q75DRAFT_746895 [Abortiporus biennis]
MSKGNDTFGARRASFKLPPASVRDTTSSQESRRKKALEEQKRRRAERFDSSRQLDFFADLNLGASDDEANDENANNAAANPTDMIVREGISSFASLLPPAASASSVPLTPQIGDRISESTIPPQQASDIQTNVHEKKKRSKKRKGRSKSSQVSSNTNKPGKWADKCMYAELLEMSDDYDTIGSDGIPQDIETGWVAVTPVPVGKRCIAVTHAASGIAGIVPNTTIRSRVLGKPLMKPFPSALPPHTVLDCILDDSWRANGILHVLDVLKWKGQDIADCETPFRFWWRETRLSELPSFPPPPSTASASQDEYQFSYPTTFVAIPSSTDTTLSSLVNHLIPSARLPRTVQITIPSPYFRTAGEMDLDDSSRGQLQVIPAQVKSDGLLLYVSQATYEPGTSPLSIWLPIRAYTEERWKDGMEVVCDGEGPLDQFERLVRRRMQMSLSSIAENSEVSMEI